MKLTRASHYALQALAYLAARRADDVVPSHRIAQERGISEKFLLKVLKPLVEAEVLRSSKGPNGGYRLARSADTISVLDVVEAVDGPLQAIVPGDPRNGVAARLEAVCREICDRKRERLAQCMISHLGS